MTPEETAAEAAKAADVAQPADAEQVAEPADAEQVAEAADADQVAEAEQVADTAEPTEHAETATAQRLAVRWAEYTKTAGMYPSTSQRVAQCLADLVGAIDDVGHGQAVIVQMLPQEVVVGKTRFPIGGEAKLLWLYSRLHKCALQGVVFSPDAERAIPEFTARLLANFARQTTTGIGLETLWPDTYEGLKLLHRRFEGGFLGAGSGGEGENSGDGSGGVATSPGGSMPMATGAAPGVHGGNGGGDQGRAGSGGPKSPESEDGDREERDELLSRLSIEGPVHSAVGRIQEKLVGKGLVDKDTVNDDDFRLDLLGQVVRALPSDAKGYEDIVQASEGVLGCIEDEVDGQEALGNAPMDSVSKELRGLVFMASRMFFRPGPRRPLRGAAKEGEEAEKEERTKINPRERGHAGDELVTADLDALLDEIKSMPELDTELLFVDVDEVVDEQLDVYLHYLINRSRKKSTENLYTTLRALLNVENAREVERVGRALRRIWDLAQTPVQRERIFSFVEAERMPRLLRKFGILSMRNVLENFSQLFMLFLDALDFTRTDDREELRQLLSLMGGKRLLMEAPTLVKAEGGLLERDRAQRLLTFNTQEVLAFAPPLLATNNADIRNLALDRIRRAKIDVPEALLLDVTSDPDHITAEYLSALISASITGNMSIPAADHVATCLGEIVDAAAKTEGPLSPRRLDAIRALGAIRAPRARMILSQIARRRVLFVFPAEPGPVRELVRAALRGAFREEQA